MNEYESRLLEMGKVATALFRLHLKDPKKFDAFEITERLFNKFEELDLGGDEYGNS